MANIFQKVLVGAGQALVKAGGNGREVATPEHLDALIREKFTAIVLEGLPFTAFEVTTALRNENPTLEIAHGGAVRERVHSLANAVGLDTSISNAKGGATVFFPPGDDGCCDDGCCDDEWEEDEELEEDCC
jgi:hypothetical protein